MEQFNKSPEKHLITFEEREELQRALGQVGLVDATLFEHPTIEHPEDDRWIIPSAN